MIYKINGNLFDSPATVYCHQVNCIGVMGAGIAVEVKKRYPEMFEEYKTRCKQFGNKNLGDVQFHFSKNGKILANMFAQDGISGQGGVATNYEKFDECIGKVYLFALRYGVSVAFPYLIGCGLGGGNWDRIYDIISSYFGDEVAPTCYIVEFNANAASTPAAPTTITTEQTPKVTIYTDGSCSGNPGPGGWGAILECNGHSREFSGGEDETTNNRMELTAVIKALENLKRPCEVDLYSDSKYVIDALDKGWVYNWEKNNWVKKDKKPALNADLWQQLLVLIRRHVVHFHWVKGHADNPKNNRCDQLAVTETQKRKGDEYA